MKLGSRKFFGTVKKSLENENYFLTESLHPSQSVIPCHSHDVPYFSLVIKGVIEERNGFHNYCRKAGTLVYHPPDYKHNDFFYEGDAEVFNIQPAGELLEQVHSCFSDHEFQFVFNEVIISRARKIYLMFLKNQDSGYIGSEISYLIENIADDGGANMFRIPAWFKEILSYIEQHYSGEIFLKGLSELVGIHPVHISRTFRKYLDCTLGDYIHKVRIEQACRQLRTKNISIGRLAHQLGYVDHSHFTKNFVKRVGIPPSEYKALLKA